MFTHLFSEADQEKIRAAVLDAESRTSGEIVPYVVTRSDAYEEAIWRSSFLFALLAFAMFMFVWKFSELWLPFSLTTLAFALSGCTIAATASIWLAPALRRVFAGESRMQHRVFQRAAQAFLADEVFNTRERTGILIFLSLFERKVVVLGDSGINAKVSHEEWEEIVGDIVAGIRAGCPTDGLIEAIRKCGALLQKHGVEIRGDDIDELPDTLRIGGSD